MNQQYRKKLIEVALPLEAINKESAREKSIRHGHPSTLHLWWARRPLAACRAVLFASLVDDPDSDPAYAKYDAETREHMAGEKRQQLFELIEELVKWENSNDELIINAARAEIARCVASRKLELGELKKDHKLLGGETVYDLVVKGHGDLKKLRSNVTRLPKSESVNAFLAEHAPPVLDPFCGGGSIPLEAQRLGLRAYASDLNPVPVLINKALVEIPPNFANQPPVNPESRKQGKLHQTGKGAQGLADDVHYYGKWMRDEAEKRIGHFYPRVKITAEMTEARPELKPYAGEELTVIAWLWSRTIASPNPAIGGTHVPLVRSFWVATKPDKRTWVEPVTSAHGTNFDFAVRTGTPRDDFNPSKGTVERTGARCILTGQPIPFDYIRREAKAGRMQTRLMAIVAEGKRGRVYLSPTPEHEQAANISPPDDVPETPIPEQALGFRVQLYGMDRHRKLFTNRQLVALMCFTHLVREARDRVVSDGGTAEYANAVATYLAFAVSRVTDYASSLTTWASNPQMEILRSTFARQALAMIWDFAEGNVFGPSSGTLDIMIEASTKAIRRLAQGPAGQVIQEDARAPKPSGVLVSTDPPYYDNIGYADLSDWFYVWLRQSLNTFYPNLFSTLLTPKSQELIATPHRHENNREQAMRYFEHGLGEAFSRMQASEHPDYPVTVFYAFKQSESDEGSDDGGTAVTSTASSGWETMLAGLIQAGFSITGTWPVRTERAGRSVGIGTNALASSIVLVCKSRNNSAPLANRREFLNALKQELPDALKHLQRGSIAPVDLAQAAIGPGMAVFTRYGRVMEADGSAMRVRQALALINQTLDEVLAEQEGEFDADTRWATAWFEQHSVGEGAFGVADVLARAKNTAVNALVEAGIVQAYGGKVRLLKRTELPEDWNPATDTRLRHWEIVQHLIRALETGGETAAADLLRRVGGMGEVARDLAYRLYNICERKGWASEALAYNGLVIAWPEITKLSQQAPTAPVQQQADMF